MCSDINRWERETRELVESTVAKLKNEGVTADGRIIDSIDVARALAEMADKDHNYLIRSGKPGARADLIIIVGERCIWYCQLRKDQLLITR